MRSKLPICSWFLYKIHDLSRSHFNVLVIGANTTECVEIFFFKKHCEAVTRGYCEQMQSFQFDYLKCIAYLCMLKTQIPNLIPV